MIMLSTSPILKSTPSILAGNRLSGVTSSSPSPSTIKFQSTRISAITSTTSPEKTRSSSSSSASSSPCNLNTMLSSSCSFLSLYEVLGISMGATNQEIKSAYRRLAREFHPDATAAAAAAKATIDSKEDSSSSASDAFIKIHAAYSTLSDPAKRFVYDRDLFRRRNRRFVSYSGLSSNAATAMSGCKNSYYVGRNWETDQCW